MMMMMIMIMTKMTKGSHDTDGNDFIKTKDGADGDHDDS